MKTAKLRFFCYAEESEKNMLDTCTLGLREFEIPIGEPKIVSAIQAGSVLKKWVLHARDEEIGRNFRVSIVHNPVRFNGGYEQRRSLHVETALPKLVYGNSIQEIIESDRDRALILIRDGLMLGYGVKTSIESILKSALKRVDFTKNILLPVTSSMFFEKAAICTKKRGSTFSNVTYGVDRNGNQLRWYSKRKALSIYDKGAEVESSHPDWIPLLRTTMEGNRKCALIRFEARLMGRMIIKELSKRIEVGDVTFADIWSEAICCRIIFDQLSSIPGLPCILRNVSHQTFDVPTGCSSKDAYLLKSILRNAQHHGFTEALKEFSASFSKTTYYRLIHFLPGLSNVSTEEIDLWEVIANKLNHPSI